jgi:hypothetical protein
MLYQLTISYADEESSIFVLSTEQLVDKSPWIGALICDVFYLDYTSELVRYQVEPVG